MTEAIIVCDGRRVPELELNDVRPILELVAGSGLQFTGNNECSWRPPPAIFEDGELVGVTNARLAVLIDRARDLLARLETRVGCTEKFHLRVGGGRLFELHCDQGAEHHGRRHAGNGPDELWRVIWD